MSDQETKPETKTTPNPKKRKSPSSPSSPSKRPTPGTTHATGSLPPQGYTGTTLPANHPLVVYEILERIIEEATPEHRRIVAERYGIEVKKLHFAWRTIKKNALKTLKQGI